VGRQAFRVHPLTVKLCLQPKKGVEYVDVGWGDACFVCVL